MKITDVKTYVVGNPPPHFGGRYFVFLKLTTDNGIEGFGEVYTATFGPHVVTAMIEDVCARHVVGRDPFKIETMWRNVYGRGYSLRPDLSLVSVLSGIETACWDIVGKAVEKPVYELLGGQVHERLRSYTYLYPKPDEPLIDGVPEVYRNPDRAAERAAEFVAMGFTAVKFDPAAPIPVSTRASPAWSVSTFRPSSAPGSARRSAPRPISCSAPMASSPPPARSASPSASSHTILCGSRNRPRPRCPRRWRGSRARPRSRSPPASG